MGNDMNPIRNHRSAEGWVLRVCDGVGVFGVLWAATTAYSVPWDDHYFAAGMVGALLFVGIGEHRRLYGSWHRESLQNLAVHVGWTWLLAAAFLLFIIFAVKIAAIYSRVVITVWFLTVPVALILARTALAEVFVALKRRKGGTRSAAVAGAGALGVGFARTLLADRAAGIRLQGFYDDRKAVGFRPIPACPAAVAGGIEELIRDAHGGKINLVYIALPLNMHHRIERLMAGLADSTVTVYYLPDMSAFDLLSARMYNIGGFAAISVYDTPFSGSAAWLKRLEDVVLASLILLVVALPMALIAAGVAITSSGPVVFKQQRYGLGGEPVEVWKFRTMTVCEDGVAVCRQARRRDARVTRLGAFLRRTSLDELPQFFNVLQGTMSVVGPRPHAVAHNERYRKLIPGYMLRHKVKPGITGWAQINGWRGETDTLAKMQMRVKYDLDYIRNWSLWLDLKIVALTAIKFVSKNAY